MTSQVLQDATNRPRGGGGEAATPGRRPPGATLSKDEVLDIYQNCIRLAAESKINAKNSFSLRLIEHMEDLVRAEEEEETNFQKASCTLDAGVQIYSYRVDAVHTDAFKTLQGLNRTAVQESDDGLDGDDAGAGNAEKNKRRRNTDPTATLEEYKALDVKKFDLSFTVDPLFHRTSAQFDAGGAHGLLLHNLDVLHGCEIVFDSSDVPEQILEKQTAADVDVKVAMQGLPPSLLKPPHCNKISPAVEELRRRMQETGAVSMRMPETGMSVDSIMQINAVKPPVRAADMPYPDEVVPPTPEQFDHAPEGSGDGSAFFTGEDGASPGGQSSVYYGMSEEIGPGDLGEVSNMPGCTVDPMGTSMATVHDPADEADDANSLEHLISRSLGTGLLSGANWAGASHWRYHKAANVAKKPAPDAEDDTSSVQTGRAGGRGKKQELDFLRLPSLPADAIKLSAKPGELCLAASTLELPASTLLPEDHKYQVQDLMKHFLRPRSMWSRRKASHVNNGDADNVGAGDFFHMDSFEDGAGGGDADGFGDEGEFDEGQWRTRSDEIALAEAPRKVNRVAINYSRVAKQVDVRELKELLWGSIDAVAAEDPEEEHPEASVSFNEIIGTLPESSAAGAIEDLSVHLCFICALHLANEHGLSITSGQNLDTMTIRLPEAK
eukprot:jgi/Tetstr1/463627/TSEL_008489.t1